MTVTKDKSILDLLKKIDLENRGWKIVDYWEGDLCAIGIVAVKNSRRLVYVSTYGKNASCYNYECEVPQGLSLEEYATLGSGEDVDFATLLKVMEKHFG